MNSDGEQTTLPVIDKVDLRPLLQCASDPGAKAMVWQKSLGHVRNKNRVAYIGIAHPNFLYRQVVGKVARAEDLNAIVKDKQPDWCAHKIIPML